MNLYRISQDLVSGFDTYDSAVVAATDEDAARRIHPYNECGVEVTDLDWGKISIYDDSWCGGPEYVMVERIGVADEKIKQSVICKSFNAV